MNDVELLRNRVRKAEVAAETHKRLNAALCTIIEQLNRDRTATDALIESVKNDLAEARAVFTVLQQEYADLQHQYDSRFADLRTLQAVLERVLVAMQDEQRALAWAHLCAQWAKRD